MLTELRVENLGIIDEATVVLGRGLTAITGETGAGKTLLAGAVALLLGDRADAGAVRAGASEARVEARFVDADGTEHVVSRVVPAEGRSRAYLDGRMATAAEVAAVTAERLDLFGQHAHQRLLEPGEQRAALDAFAGGAARRALDEYRRARAEVRRCDDELLRLGGDARARARELDLLRYQLEEIDAAGLADADEDARLAAEAELLADAEAHRGALAEARAALDGPAADGVAAACGALGGRPPFAELAERLRALQAELTDLARAVRTVGEAVVADPERLAAVHARRAVLGDLRRKYGETLAEVQRYADETRARVEELVGWDARAADLQAEQERARQRMQAAAAELTRVRRAAAPELAAAATARLGALAMARARLAVRVEPAPPGEDGADAVTFELATSGEPHRPLAKVASGGELARVMLALALPGGGGLPETVVFDEVDAGIGGAAGAAVGRELAELGRCHQVVCVTHLAQVAAAAGVQFVVDKRERGGRVVAEVALLADDDARTRELSRMLAGQEDSTHARRHAAELLAAQRPR